MKRFIGTGIVSICFFGFLAFGLFGFASQAYAQPAGSIMGQIRAEEAESLCGVAGGPVLVTCPPTGLAKSLKTVGEKIISPAFRIALIQSLLNLSQFVLNRLAYEAAVAIATGGPGEDSLFYNQTPTEAFEQLGLEVAGEAIGSISELSVNKLGIEFNLCQPNLDLLQLSLALGIKQKYQPTAPKCDFMEIMDNWDAFGAGLYQRYLDPEGRADAILSSFAKALRPGQNELTATLRINIAIDQKIHEQKLLQFLERNQGSYKPVKDFIAGTVTTPAETLQGDFEAAVKTAKEAGTQVRVGDMLSAGELIGGLALSTASTFTNVLLSQLFNRIYTGLFDTDLTLSDPFDLEATSGGDKQAAQERFASIIATNPISTAEFNVLSQFVVCTAQGVMNRGLNDCVMDVNFLAAVSRGSSGAAMTVQEAIDEGLLNGDWPLISPDNESANQDPFCYTYGYCYGNLVKLRKARVIPIGWELAAQRNSTSSPASLQEIINGFDDCTQDGTIGPASASNSDTQWCHLIDPNWVLKYPETQCRAIVNGEVRISSLGAGRTSVCADAPSCIGEDNDGNCADGFGYCVQEKNVWRFRGDECPQEYATCLSFTNTETEDDGAFLVSTVDYSVCDQDNAGCRWYRTNKYVEDAGTEDTDDDSYEWLADGDDYVVAQRDVDMKYTSGSSSVGRTSYSYTSDSGETYDYEQYAYEDRLYLTNDATQCSEESVGCTQLYEFDDDLYLNLMRNPSFEDDEDQDGVPDGWVFGSESDVTYDPVGDSYSGSNTVVSLDTTGSISQSGIQLAANNFYTFSFYAKDDDTTSYEEIGGSIKFLNEKGETIDFSGYSYSGDCHISADGSYFSMGSYTLSTDDWERWECLFTTTGEDLFATVSVATQGDDLRFDAFQLELGEDANTFVEGYSGTPSETYYQIPPNYLGCSGDETDPEACDSYSQVCSAQEVGCSLYTPEDGDPNVPAIISELDECPSECVGYTTYKQEATDYESEEFPLYFIADNASSCSQQYVGCDSYTNLGSVEAGGEGIEYYTDIRFCLSTDIADASSDFNTPATFFTWEGSDNEGYQLQTWYLLESNYGGTKDTFDQCSTSSCTPFEETDPGLAPCTHIQMNSANEVRCLDLNTSIQTDVWGNADCDEHDDIFDNPDCREFFDTEGNIHYRQYSDTISISDECAAYRKDAGDETDCEDSGGFWTDQGFCRYYVLPEESTQCPAEQNGCREYTGGTGRNATTILDETFEGGTYEDFVMAGLSNFPVEISISNESVATEGHSLYVLAPSTGMAGIETTQIYLDSTDTTETYDEAGDEAGTSTTCTGNGGTIGDSGCDITDDVDGDGSDDEDCTVSDEEESCGALTGELVAGKTFVLEFWAKGNGNLYVTFEEEGGTGTSRDFVDPDATISSVSELTPVVLDGAWALYSLGPVDTSSYEDFDENAVIRFATDEDGEFYLDNISLKQVEENITLIKDSWVVPSTCDQTPGGVTSDQYYLGCEAYTDHNGSDVDLYQFSDLCSEEVVGCDGFYHTANSDSPYTQIYNARCVYSTDSSQNLTDDETVTTNTTCEVDGMEYCTISAGEGFCTFDTDQAFTGELPVDTSGTYDFGIVFGPETVVVSGDTPVYFVADDSFECTSSFVGCQELGEATYTQDQSEVDSFESVYFINTPEDYDNILCDQDALFCEEWESSKGENFYFKDPIDKTCEYETGIVIENRSYFGWFRSDSSEPCYWEDKNSDGAYDLDDDEAYLIAGENFGVWTNGDEDDSDDDVWDYYDGWVASCESRYDLCTEFIDLVDTGGGLNENGQSYYFVNDELLDEDYLTDSQRCNGLVSQKFGCALFNNTTTSELSYNASASYVSSAHADILYGEEKNSLVDPISCSVEDGGVFSITSANASALGLEETIDLCARRCEYKVELKDSITTSLAEKKGPYSYYERSCVIDSDCPALTTALGEDVTGTCADVTTDVFALADDSNEVLKVNRDRTCAAWLACESSRTSWNTVSNQYDSVCDSINLCVEGSVQGDSAKCTNWDQRDPELLTASLYSSRDVNWTGYEYSGLSIPNQLPIEVYDQFNLNPSKNCVDNYGDLYLNDNEEAYACNQYTDCPASEVPSSDDGACQAANYGGSVDGYCVYACSEAESTDYRLVYEAGPCDSSEDSGVGAGGECQVGFCEDSGDPCSTKSDCSDSETCVIGYCQAQTETSCSSDSDCEGVEITDESGTVTKSYKMPYCDPIQGVCVDVLTSDKDTRVACQTTSLGCKSYQECVLASSTAQGSCYNNRCLTDIIDSNGDGFADAIDKDRVLEESCRGYPEIDSPFPYEVVEYWKQFAVDADNNGAVDDDTDYGYSTVTTAEALETEGYETEVRENDLDPWDFPYSYVPGYQDSIVCALDEDGNLNNDCLCSYDKVQYAGGTKNFYYEASSVQDTPVLDGVCSYGDKSGFPCSDDSDCEGSGTNATGTCDKVTRTDTIYGWPGYCIEKDTSIQLNGSSDEDDQACLSWLPIDQLTGATDLYGKNTEAGFPMTDTYYCAETAYYTDLYPLGVNFASDGLVENMEPACAIYEANGYYGYNPEKYDSCYKAAYCPTGWVAIVGHIGTSTSGTDNTHCSYSHVGSPNDYSDRWAFDKYGMESAMQGCPYFCIPEGSYHMQGDDIGTSCDEDLITVDNEDKEPRSDDNVFGTKYVLAGGFSDWNDSGASDPTSVEGNFWDCVVRGVPTNETETYDLDWLNSVDGYNSKGYGYKLVDAYRLSWGITHRPISGRIGRCDYATGEPCNVTSACVGSSSDVFDACNVHCSASGICTSCLSGSGDCEYIDVGDDTPRNSGSIQGYLGCYEIVQASSSDLEVGNKAWTNRLLFSGYETSDQDGTFTRDGVPFSFTASDEPTPAGAILLSEYYDEAEEDYLVINDWGEKDSWPLPVSSCDSEPDYGGDMGFITIPYGEDFSAECTNGQTAYPAERQFRSSTDKNTSILTFGGETDSLGYPYEYISDGGDESQDDLSDYGSSDNGSGDSNTFKIAQGSVWNIMSQLYAKIYSKWRYDWDYSTTGHGAYQKVTTGSDGYNFDVSAGFESASGIKIDPYPGDGSADEFPNYDDRAPVVVSVGSCDGTQCYEATEGAFSVNELDSGNIEGEEEKNVNVSFYTYAAPNQMPIRNIIVDWGDDFSFTSIGPDWPTGSQSGSSSGDNFYKNHRGLNDADDDEFCDDLDEWGKTGDSCSTGYILFSHGYVCNAGRVDDLVDRTCEIDENGELTNSPCTGGDVPDAQGTCVFQPRVHVVDNWGWCTGFCDSNPDDDINACYGDECDFENCPSGGYAGYNCPDRTSGTSDPWVYFDGYIIVTP